MFFDESGSLVDAIMIFPDFTFAGAQPRAVPNETTMIGAVSTSAPQIVGSTDSSIIPPQQTFGGG